MNCVMVKAKGKAHDFVGLFHSNASKNVIYNYS